MESPLETLRSYGPGEIAVLTFGLVALLAVLTPVTDGAFVLLVPVVAVLGWFLLTPWAAMRGWGESLDESAEPAAAPSPSEATDDPVERLRERYANGEIDEAEFERRLETVLATADTDPETAREVVADRDPQRVTETLNE